MLEKISVIAFALLTISHAFSTEVIRTIGPQSDSDGSHSYYIELLHKVLEVTEPDFGPSRVELVPHPGQGRVIRLLAMNLHFDVMWTASTANRESDLKAIKVPIFMGGLGWRGMAIHKDLQHELAKIEQLNDLSRFVICQGEHWPDADVLQSAGLRVVRVGSFGSMLQMLSRRRCDLIPLSIFEGEAELKAVADLYPDLLFDTEILLRYVSPMYFFVHQNNTALAERLTTGMDALAQSGWLLAFMQQHITTAHVFPLTKYQQSRLFDLKNPHYLESDTTNISSYWLDIFN